MMFQMAHLYYWTLFIPFLSLLSVRSLGGSQDVYGFVLAIYSFAAFCAKPVLGRWSDAQNFTLPYLVSNCKFLFFVSSRFTCELKRTKIQIHCTHCVEFYFLNQSPFCCGGARVCIRSCIF